MKQTKKQAGNRQTEKEIDMIIKVQFGQDKTHCRIIECYDMHIEQKDGYDELICHRGEEEPKILHLGKGSTDVLYLMDKGQTVDSMVFAPK